MSLASTSLTAQPSTLGYARLVIPLGTAPKRLDCAQLYELEIERLKKEIDLLSIGLE